MTSSDPTLEGLFVAWRRTRHPDVAGAIDRRSAHVESEGARSIRAAPPKLADWLERAKVAPFEDRGALAATLGEGTAKHVKAKVVATTDWGDDPRVATALNALCVQIPWVSSGTRPTWTQIFKRLKAIRDPRTREVATAFDTAALGSNWTGPAEYFSAQFQRVADAVASAPVLSLTDAERALVDGVPFDEGTPEEDPLEAVWAAPDDPGVRLVIADRLQERGDPRGELISLQHAVEQGTADRKAKAQIKKLCKAHRDALLGPLKPILKVTTVEYRLGFLHACAAKDVVHRHPLDEALASPLARTIHTLTGPAHVLARPELVGLRDARMPTYPMEAQVLLGLDRQTPIERLTLPINSPEDRRALRTTTAFPALKHLTVSQTESADRAVICRTPLGRQVETLTFEAHDAALDVAGLGTLLPKDSQVKTLRLVHDDPYSRWSSDVQVTGSAVRLAVRIPNAGWQVQGFWTWVEEALKTLQTLGSVELVVEGTDEQRARLAALAV